MRQLALAALLIFAACGAGGDLADVPLPDYAGVEPEVAEATEKARREVARRPGSAAAWGALGDRLHAHQWRVEAATCYGRAAEIDTGEFAWPYMLGRVRIQFDFGEAAEAFERALAIDDRYAPAHVLYARALEGLGREDEARRHLERAVALDPEMSHAALGLGELALAAGDFDAAREHLERALAINPRHAEARHALAKAYMALGRKDDARREAEHATTLPKRTPMRDPRSRRPVPDAGSMAYNSRGIALREEGKIEEALAAFREAIRINPDAVEAHANLGTTLARMGRLDEAIEHLERAVEVGHDDANARLNLGIALAQRGDLDDAEMHLEEAVRIDPQNAGARQSFGIALQRRGELEAAAAQYRAAIDIDPSRTDATRRLAFILATHPSESIRDGGEALRLARRATRETGNRNPAALDALAAAYAEIGRYRDAVATARNALALAIEGDQARLAENIRERLRFYEAGRPYRE